MDVYSFIVYTPAAAKLLQTYSGNTGALVLAGSTVCEYESADRSGEKLYSVRKDSSLPAPRMCQPAGLSLEPHVSQGLSLMSFQSHSLTMLIFKERLNQEGGEECS